MLKNQLKKVQNLIHVELYADFKEITLEDSAKFRKKVKSAENSHH